MARIVSNGDAPEREPAVELGLYRQVLADLRLEPQLVLVVALLLADGRHERVDLAELAELHGPA